MIKVFGVLANTFKVKESPRVDHRVFRLHYRITVSILICSCILVCSRQFIGDPIRCINDTKFPGGVINTYCWITSTFSLPEHWHKPTGAEIPHPGVGPGVGTPKYHAYYQWVPFVLFLQAIMFYFPHWLWRMWDKGKIKGIILGLQNVELLLNNEERKKKEKRLIDYLINTWHLHNTWAFRFFVAETLNFVNIVGNIFFTDKFLGNQFTKFGTQALNYLQYDPENRTDPLTIVFPRVTKCTFHTYGVSGTIQTHDVMCILATNIISEKIYVFLWFWFVILALITGLGLVYRLVTILSESVRGQRLRFKGGLAGEKSVKIINRHCNVADWLLLYYVGDNMDPFIYSELLDGLALALEGNVEDATGKSEPHGMELHPIP